MTNQLVDFYCRHCGLDQTKEAVKLSNRWVVWNYTHCTQCNRGIIRYIDDLQNDPYYYYSKKAKSERNKYRKDLIQPHQSGFKTLYGKQYKELETQRESRAKIHKENKISRDKFFKDNNNVHNKKAVLKAIELTEDKFESNV